TRLLAPHSFIIMIHIQHLFNLSFVESAYTTELEKIRAQIQSWFSPQKLTASTPLNPISYT
ncbi:hypothetical protein QP445_15750, partial [Micrococcus luteus]|nr:hypothetical protein [Micrococcus luteus]